MESENEEQVDKNEKDEKKEEEADIEEIENDNIPDEEKLRRKEKYEKMKLKSLIKTIIEYFNKRVIISLIILLFVMFFMWIYVSCFCAVYKNSQQHFFVNIIISFVFSNIVPFFYCLIPAILRLDSIKKDSELSYLVSRIFTIV